MPWPAVLTAEAVWQGQMDLHLCVPACPRALLGLTDTEKQLLLFTCSFCSSGVIVTYLISFSERFYSQCVTDRVELFKTFASNIHHAAAFLSTQRLSAGPTLVSVFVLTRSCIFKSKACAREAGELLRSSNVSW